MKRLFFTLAIGLLLAGTASAQTFFERKERDRQLTRDLSRIRNLGRPPSTEEWTEARDNMDKARELDRMRNSQRQDRSWQGTGGGIRSNRNGGGW